MGEYKTNQYIYCVVASPLNNIWCNCSENVGKVAAFKSNRAKSIFVMMYIKYKNPLNLRHDAREVEHLSREIGHVAVHKDKKWLDDTRVVGEAWGEGSQDPIDSSH